MTETGTFGKSEITDALHEGDSSRVAGTNNTVEG